MAYIQFTNTTDDERPDTIIYFYLFFLSSWHSYDEKILASLLILLP